MVRFIGPSLAVPEATADDHAVRKLYVDLADEALDTRLLAVEAAGGTAGYQHDQVSPAAVWDVEHDLGYDPAGIVVMSADGYVADGVGVQYLITGQSLRLSFDISIAGIAYLS